MKDYASMSDVQVSKAVGDAIGIEWANLDDNYHELCYWPELDDEPRIFDPCNSPADAWPILVENHIAVVPYRHTLPQAWPTAFGLVSKFMTEDANPLRAGMVTFLKMMEGE